MIPRRRIIYKALIYANALSYSDFKKNFKLDIEIISISNDPLIAFLENLFVYIAKNRGNSRCNFKFSRGSFELELIETNYQIEYWDDYSGDITNYEFTCKVKSGNTRIIAGTHKIEIKYRDYYEDEEIISDFNIKYDSIQVGNKRAL